ncbi:UNVERIFIED_CONTAM: CASP-like protein 4B4 [Sesamum latifolium]|uniref:CASP-like protein n=1 Tax=Sesamum latifolium TaxID=2727402 RepID=A0AAW2XA22_9LAMI
MATNKHGDWKDFDRYEEYRHTFLLYVLAIAILATLYAGLQALRQFHELSTGREMFSRQNLALVDFFGDQITTVKFLELQIVAYLLISAGSSAVPLTNRMREGADNVFTDASASAISMEFLAFFSLALSALISGYKLSNQSYI